MIKISAVIITYNEEEHLEKCLGSLVGIADEIVVVDSYSTDNTQAICKKYNLPIVAIGLGEKDNDLHPFRAEFFAKALLGLES